MREAIKGTTDLPVTNTQKRVSNASAGNSTVLLYQQVNDERYYDEACLVPTATANNIANPCRQ